MYGTFSQHMHCRPIRSFSWTSNNARMSQLHSAGATIFQESPLDEGDESLERAAAAIWVQSAAEVGPERLFQLDKNLTILSKAVKETHILLWGLLVSNLRRISERKEGRLFTGCMIEMTEESLVFRPSLSFKWPSSSHESLLNSCQTPFTARLY